MYLMFKIDGNINIFNQSYLHIRMYSYVYIMYIYMHSNNTCTYMCIYVCYNTQVVFIFLVSWISSLSFSSSISLSLTSIKILPSLFNPFHLLLTQEFGSFSDKPIPQNLSSAVANASVFPLVDINFSLRSEFCENWKWHVHSLIDTKTSIVHAYPYTSKQVRSLNYLATYLPWSMWFFIKDGNI